MATNFVGKIDIQSTPLVRMTLARAARPVLPAYDKKGNCYTGRRQTNYLIRWTQPNQLSNKLTLIIRRLEGYPDGLQSGFALHLVLKRKIVLVDSNII